MRSLNAAIDSRLTREQAVHIVDAIMKQYPNRPAVEDVYLAGLVTVLRRYPLPVAVKAAHPTDGVVARPSPFLPVAGELIEWCDEQRREFLRQGMERVAAHIRQERANAKAKAEAEKATQHLPRLPSAK